MDNICVMINQVIVYVHVVTAGHNTIMQVRQLERMYCIEELVKNGVDAAVMIWRNDEWVVLPPADTDTIITLSSRMNAPDFVPEPAWYDDMLKDKTNAIERLF